MFWYRLTLALGHKSVSEAKDSIDSNEFAHWLAYYKLEPFGGERDDLRQAYTSCIIANLFLGKGQKAYEISDFMYKSEDGKQKQMGIKEMEMVCRMMAESSQANNTKTPKERMKDG